MLLPILPPSGPRGSAAEERAPPARLAEAEGLARAIGLAIAGSLVINIHAPRPGTLFGSGKVEELKAEIAAREATLVVIDGALSPVQQRNLEKAWGVKVIDRTGLILEIFAERARTSEGRLQVELAQLRYQKSRLVRSWTHLERQRGGLGKTGGPGETQIEADRRMIRERIAKLEARLETVKRTRSLQRKGRKKVPVPVIALVGYTNAGKSTLFNALTSAGVFAENLLFATLDPTMRAITLPSGQKAVLSDTVGFISQLPHELVAAFRATLEEVLSADVILHVRDAATPYTAAERADVVTVLGELGIEERDERLIEILNKIDLLPADHHLALIPPGEDRIIAVSAVTGAGLGDLLTALDRRLGHDRITFRARISGGEGAALAWVHANGEVVGERIDDEGITHLTIVMSPEDFGRFEKRFAHVSHERVNAAPRIAAE